MQASVTAFSTRRSPRLNTESRNFMATFFCERQILGSDAHLSINLCSLARVLLKSSERGRFLRVQMKFPICSAFHFLIPVGLFLSHNSFSSRRVRRMSAINDSHSGVVKVPFEELLRCCQRGFCSMVAPVRACVCSR